MERVYRGVPHGGGVAFELDQILAAGSDDRARGLMVAVEADEAFVQIGRGEEGAGGGHFVLLLGREHGSDGDEADDLGEPVGDGIAVEGERLGSADFF